MLVCCECTSAWEPRVIPPSALVTLECPLCRGALTLHPRIGASRSGSAPEPPAARAELAERLHHVAG
jgi:hypothetical protein